MSDISKYIQLLFQSVYNRDAEAVSNILSVIPIESCDPQDNLLVELLEAAYSASAKAVTQQVIARWDYDDQISILSRIFLIERLSADILKEVVGLFEGTNYETTMIDLMSQPDSDKLRIACNKVDKVFGEQDSKVYTALLDYIVKDLETGGLGSKAVQESLRSSVALVSEYAPVPSWVKDYLGDTVDERVSKEEPIARGVSGLPLESELIETQPIEDNPAFELPSSADVARIILKGELPGVRLFTEQQELMDLISAAYSTLSKQEKVEALAPLHIHGSSTDTATDLGIYRLLGPVTMHSGLLLDRQDPCSIYGGCRMLVCLEYENTDREKSVIEEDPYSVDSEVTWFTGICGKCELKIRKPCHAVRRPIINGGWKGCYCSWKCMREDSPEGKGTGMPNLLFDRYVDKLEERMKEYGIQDRDYDDEEMAYTGQFIMSMIRKRNEELEEGAESGVESSGEEEY